MRVFKLSFIAIALQLVQCGTVSARWGREFSATRTTRDNHSPADVLTSRQHHEPRALLDVCAYIGADTDLNIGLLGIPLRSLLDLDICLCLSALPLALETNVKLKSLTTLFGSALVEAVLKLLINLPSNGHHCTYPSHSQPICSASDPCGFNCDPPYVKSGNDCVCPPPYMLCNGVCGAFPQGCGSAVPRALNARSNTRSYGRISRQMAAQAKCAPQETVCGVYGSGAAGHECVDTNTNLESCGGCVVPSPFLPPNATIPSGRDCTAIEGADAVACVSGSCVVQSCEDGLVVNDAGNGCQQRMSPSLAFNIVAQAMDRSGLVVRTPELPDLSGVEEEAEPQTTKPKEGAKTKSPQADYYPTAWFRD